MVKYLPFSFIFFVFLFSCSNKTEEVSNINTISSSTPSKTEPNISEESVYSIQLFLVDSLNPKLGFGYNILANGVVFIHQATIPSVAGNKAFETKEKAELVANLMAQKLKNNIMPPSVSKKELDSLNILTP